MKLIFRLFSFIYLRHYIPEFIVYTILYTLFGVVNFTMLIPVLNLMFDKNWVVVGVPDFSFSVDYIVSGFKYIIYSVSYTYGKIYALLLICAVIVSFSFMCNLFRYLAARVILRLRIKMAQTLRDAIYQKLILQSVRYHTETKRGELLSVMTNELGEIERSIIGAFRSWLTDPIIILSYFIVLFYLSAELTLFTIVFLPLSGWLVASLLKKLKKLGKDSQKWLEDMSSFTEETLNGVKVIQSYTAIHFFINKFKQINQGNANTDRSINVRRELASPLSESLGVFIVVILVMTGGYLILEAKDSSLTASAFLSYLVIYSQIISPLKSFSNNLSNVQRGIVATSKVFEILDTPNDIQESPSAVHKETMEDGIHLKNVYFAYQKNRWVLQNINIHIKKGESVALIGESGSGKTTLSHLINRFYDVQKGGIFIDGCNVKDLKLDDLRALIAYVPQEAVLFHDTIENNIVFGKAETEVKKMMQVAKATHVDTFVNTMSEKYQTHVGEKGMKLSGGQRQRVTIARAIYKNAPILLLDEATSALDSKSEKWVQKAIETIMKDKTSIIIAHRLSTVKNVDRIIVLDKGRIVEQGSHKELIKKKDGYYYNMVKMQKIN